MVGVIVGVRRDGPRRTCQGFTLRTTDRGVGRSSPSATSRTEPSSRPATSSSTRRRRSRSASGIGPRTASRSRSGSRTRPSAARGGQPPAVMTGRIASSSAGVIVTSYDPRTIPSRSTAKIHGSDSRPHSSVMSVAWSWSCSRRGPAGAPPSANLSLYGSTLMNVTSGFAAAIGLKWSSVGPHCGAGAELRGREHEHERLVRRERVGDRGRVEGRIRLRVGRDLRQVATDVGGGRRSSRPERASPTWTVGTESRTGKVRRTVSAGEPGASVVNSAPQVPARREVGVEDVHAAVVLDRPDERAVGRGDDLGRVACRGRRRRP